MSTSEAKYECACAKHRVTRFSRIVCAACGGRIYLVEKGEKMTVSVIFNLRESSFLFTRSWLTRKVYERTHDLGGLVKHIMGKIEARVKQVKDRLNGEFYRDHYDRDNLMFRHFDRGALYSIYFHNNELLHVEVGPFLEGGLSINGGMEKVEAVIKKDSSFNFVQEDISSCLESAYK